MNTLKKTLLNIEGLNLSSNKSILFVGLSDIKQILSVALFAGYNKTYIEETVSSAKSYLDKEKNQADINTFIIAASYDYYNYKCADAVPFDEIPYCTFEGLKEPAGGFKKGVFYQGIQFAKELIKEYSDVSVALYCRTPEQIFQAKSSHIDYINSYSSMTDIPFTILEYLRIKNVDLFKR